jgi:hypothetical protein
MTDQHDVEYAVLNTRTNALESRADKVETKLDTQYDELHDMIKKVDDKVTSLKVWILVAVASGLWQIVQSFLMEKLHK